jgi:DinB superfamily
MISPAPETSSERERLLELLRRTEALYLGALRNVSAAQASFKPSPDRWSIAEVAEHVAVEEEFMYRLAQNASPSTRESDQRIDLRIHRLAADRGRYGSVTESAAAFSLARKRTIEYLRRTKADFGRWRVLHPTGDIDVYQNLLIGAYHPERHAKQIAEIKSSDAYPR